MVTICQVHDKTIFKISCKIVFKKSDIHVGTIIVLATYKYTVTITIV